MCQYIDYSFKKKMLEANIVPEAFIKCDCVQMNSESENCRLLTDFAC